MLTTLATLFTLGPPAHASTEASYCYGDADGDGYYDASNTWFVKGFMEDWHAGSHTCDP